ncbi:MAG: molybdopterin converting factor subunit 1 [Alphaproteobacteria bacterium]|nr:molybdopterin converting factor subunit 1 [Alphaproteobacteria bacterium]
MKIRYFAWLRSKTGVGGEEIALPDGVATVAQLMDWLGRRGPGYADAFANRAVIRAAVNQDYVAPDHPVRDGDEVAFFPPVTGG